ncbi:MAG: glycosyltransferase family 2 protein [Lachnospiraceae bacterium]
MISVIIPTYNCEKYIGKAIESVIHQDTKEVVEIIVIDDGSKDQTKSVVQSYMNQYLGMADTDGDRSITYFRNGTNKGVAETRNVGIRAAQGEYIAFLDADDWWSKDKLRKQIQLMRKKKAFLVFSGRELMHADGRTTGRCVSVPETVTYQQLLMTNYIPCSSVLIKTDVAREFYMSNDELHEDYIMWLKVLQKYKKAYGINEPLLKTRLAQDGKSRNKLKSAKMHFGVYRYMGIPVWQSLFLFVGYAFHGVKKYWGISQR